MASGAVSVVCDLLLVLISVVATASNALVLLVFYRKPGLRTLSNRFVINLLATNLLTCWLLLPLILTDSMMAPPSQTLCAISQGISTGLCAASVLSVLLIAVDQYYAVIDPLHYHSRIDNTRCAFMITFSLCFSVCCAVVGGLFYSAPHSIWTLCGDREIQPSTIPSFVPDIYISVFSVAYSVLTFFLPFSVICWMYLSIYFAAHKNSQRTRRNGSSTGYYANNAASTTPPVDYAIVNPGGQTGAVSSGQVPSSSESPKLSVKSMDSNDPNVFTKPSLTRSPTRSSIRSTSSYIMNTLRCRISNASMFRYREETRAARISALVVVMGLVCWCPYSLVVLLSSPVVGVQVPHHIAKISITLLVVATVISPLVFAHRNRRIQRDLRKIFGLARRPASSTLSCGSQRPRPQASGTQRQTKRVLPPNYSHTALEVLGSLAEGGDEHRDTNNSPQQKNGATFLSRVWWKEGVQIVTKIDKVSGKSLICVPEVALDVDNSRSSFSSGGSTSTQRSTSAASISSYTGDEC